MNVKRKFFLKLLSKYFLFGYLCSLGLLLLLFISYETYKNFYFPKNLLAVFFLICCIPLLGQFFRILLSTNYKYRYYKISLYRLKTRGYKDEFFECEMHEPCFRLIIKDLLKSEGYAKEYYILRDKCRGKNFRVERAKEKLLAKVMKEHNEKVI